MNYFLEIILFFLINLLIEVCIVILFIKERFFKILLYILLINFVSWPIANLMYSLNVNIFVVEILVFIFEFIFIMALFNLSYKKALVLSFAINITSFVIGLIFLD